MGEHIGNFLDLKKVCLLNIVIDIVHHIRGFNRQEESTIHSFNYSVNVKNHFALKKCNSCSVQQTLKID